MNEYFQHELAIKFDVPESSVNVLNDQFDGNRFYEALYLRSTDVSVDRVVEFLSAQNPISSTDVVNIERIIGVADPNLAVDFYLDLLREEPQAIELFDTVVGPVLESLYEDSRFVPFSEVQGPEGVALGKIILGNPYRAKPSTSEHFYEHQVETAARLKDLN